MKVKDETINANQSKKTQNGILENGSKENRDSKELRDATKKSKASPNTQSNPTTAIVETKRNRNQKL